MADSFTPDVGQQIAPDGTVTYDFDAHLHARGIDLDVHDDLVESPTTLSHKVRWLLAGVEMGYLEMVRDVVGENSLVISGTLADVVYVVAGAEQRALLTGLGNSGFVQAGDHSGGQNITIAYNAAVPQLEFYVDGALVATL